MTKLYSGSSKNSTYMALLSASPFYKLNDKFFWIVNMDSQQRFLKTHIGHFRNHIAEFVCQKEVHCSQCSGHTTIL